MHNRFILNRNSIHHCIANTAIPKSIEYFR
jgi:hypothetical protein